MTEPILSARGLTRRYGGVAALDNVDIDIAQGEFLALLGPSGCGKTTLLRCIGGFVQPTSGEVRIEGKPVQGVPAHKRPVNTVFQNYALFPHMTVAQNVAYGPQRAGVAAAEVTTRVREALKMVGLPDHGERYPTQLSGGQQQRVALARAIINRPKVLLLDEPLGALDLKLRKHMQIELKRLQEQLGITFVFVTHDQEEALVMADRIAVMNAGKIEQIGTGEEIYRSPASLFVADFIGDANLIDVEVAGTGEVSLARGGDFLGRLQTASVGSFRMLARPEQLSFLGPDSVPPTLRLAATITRSIFVGDALRVYADLADGTEVAVKLVDERARTGLATGQQVSIGWYGDDARLFPMPR
jgi:spermidine/putrescine transport system ATP-binding protein